MGEERVIFVTLGEGHQLMGLSTAQVLWFFRDSLFSSGMQMVGHLSLTHGGGVALGTTGAHVWGVTKDS